MGTNGLKHGLNSKRVSLRCTHGLPRIPARIAWDGIFNYVSPSFGGMIDNAGKAETLLHFGTGGREVATTTTKWNEDDTEHIWSAAWTWHVMPLLLPRALQFRWTSMHASMRGKETEKTAAQRLPHIRSSRHAHQWAME